MEKIKDKDITILLGNALRAGVYLSLTVALIGSIIYLSRHGHEKNIFIGQKFVERDENIAGLLHDTFNGIKQGRGYYIIQLGVLLLIVTPLVRVILSLIAFAFERDGLYVIITAIVLFIITLSILSGFGG
ncbi:MAG: DUF1634 domain-containing protein [Arachidicoccus sp.]|nr:DUF1634 domain-containing protein [Arachidicoccus sp.]